MPGPFRVRTVDLVRVQLPLVQAFATAHGTTQVKEALLVHVRTDDADGWGECGALATPGYSRETIDVAHRMLRDYLVPAVRDGVDVEDAPGTPFARAALEGALLDAELRAEGRSLAQYLLATRERVVAGVAIGIQDDIEALVALATAYADQGYRRIKCKIVPGYDVEPIAALRKALGADIEIAADANGAYSFEEALALTALDEYDVQCIEQPLAPDALQECALLAAGLETRICLDESVTSAASAALAISVGAASIVNVKPGRVGGIDRARRVHDACTATATPLLIGGMLETGIGRAANLAVAGLPSFTETGDCSASDRYFAEDLTEPFVLDADGTLAVPTGPGIGVEPRPDMLRRSTVFREVLRPA